MSEHLIAVLGAAVPIIKQLLDSKLVVAKGATIYHKYSEIEYRFHITIGSENSRAGSIIKTLQSYLQKPVEFDNVIEISGYGLPHNENLKELEIIKINEHKATIDFATLLRTIKSELVILMIRMVLPQELTQKLTTMRISKNLDHYGDYIEASLDVALDYADLWYKTFDSFTVRDIQFTFNLYITISIIEDLLPSDFKRNVRNAAIAATSGNQRAAEFLKKLNDNFLTFEDENRLPALVECISVEPAEYFEITSVIPRMQSCEILGIRYPIVLPGSMKILLLCNLEGRQTALHGILKLDLRKFIGVLSHIISEIKKQSRGPF